MPWLLSVIIFTSLMIMPYTSEGMKMSCFSVFTGMVGLWLIKQKRGVGGEDGEMR